MSKWADSTHGISGPGGDPIRNPDVPSQRVIGGSLAVRCGSVAMVFIGKSWKITKKTACLMDNHHVLERKNTMVNGTSTFLVAIVCR